MNLTFTDPTTKETLVLTEFSASIQGNFNKALGRDHDDRYCFCDDEDTTLWPIRFNLTARGTIDMAKEGRLRAEVTGTYSLDRGEKIPQNQGGYHIRLRREATEQDLGGFVAHDRVRAMVQAKDVQLQGPARTALLAAVSKTKKAEDVASSMHAARAQVAGTVLQTIKKG